MAFAPTWRKDETRGFRALIALLVCGLVSMLLLVPALMFLWPHNVGGYQHVVNVGSVFDLPSRQPVYYEDGDFWLVKLDDLHVLALSAVDPHVRHCHVPWRPDFLFRTSSEIGSEEPGWFRDPCSGSTYDLAGNRIFGPTPRGLDHYEVRIDQPGSTVRVIADPEHLTPGAAGRSGDMAPVRP